MHLRIARHTNDLTSVSSFYIHVFNLEILGRFEDHEHYDGIFLGRKDQSWHLEFTTSDESAQHKPDEDDIIVFYPETKAEYDHIIENIRRLNIPVIPSKNPYWNENGIMVRDPDDFNVIVSDLKAFKK